MKCENKSSGIYQITNKANGEFYIGSARSFEQRCYGHAKSLRKNKHHNIRLQRSWNKYGEESFEFKELLSCDTKDLIMYEQICIDGLKPEYNIAKIAGSCLGTKRADEVKVRQSAARKGEGNPMYGRKHSEETKRKMLEFSLSEKNPHRGKTISDEQKKKLSEKLKGKVISDWHRQRISESKIGVKRPAHVVEAVRKASLEWHKNPENMKNKSAKMKEVWQREGFAEKQSRARKKLTDDQIREVRELSAAGEISQKKIGEMYNIAQGVVSNIHQRITYSYIED